MPIVIPEFVQFQGVLFPLRGLWNNPPPEGDRFVNAEIDWGSPGLFGVSCVQFQLSGNSPVAFSQIAALSVDNSRCGSDVDFIFPDSGFVLTVPGFNQGVYPVFTNALMFYASAPSAALGDITITQILNSVPPPVAIQPSLEQAHAAAPNVPLWVNGNSVVIPPPTSGTVEAFTLVLTVSTSAGGVCQFQLIDGAGVLLYAQIVTIEAGTYVTSIPVTGVRLRFTNGLNAVVSGSTITANEASITVNLYYSVP